MGIKQFFCKHRNIIVEDAATEKGRTIILGKCKKCGKQQITIIRTNSNSQRYKRQEDI